MSKMRPVYLCSVGSSLVSDTPNKAIKFSEELFYVHLYKYIESKFYNTTLLNLYKLCLPHDKFPLFCNHMWQMLSLFWKYFTREQFFSLVNTVNSPYRTQLNRALFVFQLLKYLQILLTFLWLISSVNFVTEILFSWTLLNSE
jgi:hypothetical protein